jgi:DNA (cytosine-5)-methyltransferase 1
VNYIDLFHGIGGFALGAYWAGMKFENHFCSDIEPYCQKLYKLRFPESVQLGDITKIDTEELKKYGSDWIVTGGFPCQPFSSASHGRIIATDLFPEMFRIIKQLKPKFIICENVQRKPIAKAGESLESIGYKTTIRNIKANEIGADHERSRWWLLAHPNYKSKFLVSLDAEMEMLPNMEKYVWGWANYRRAIRIFNGLPAGVDRLKGLGNAIVPQIAELLFRQIKPYIKGD